MAGTQKLSKDRKGAGGRVFTGSQAQKRRPWTSLIDHLVGRGNLKPVGIYLFWLVNNFLVNLLGIPDGTLRGLDSDGRCFLRTAPKNESGPNL
ncbi:hypothetical protein [Pseudomonas sp. HLMP]|uniref:hypothetical protein n=1 Tax=Pseudomonas sp. HLMP TaxID=3153767 RepID=UPI003966CF5C